MDAELKQNKLASGKDSRRRTSPRKVKGKGKIASGTKKGKGNDKTCAYAVVVRSIGGEPLHVAISTDVGTLLQEVSGMLPNTHPADLKLVPGDWDKIVEAGEVTLVVRASAWQESEQEEWAQLEQVITDSFKAKALALLFHIGHASVPYLDDVHVDIESSCELRYVIELICRAASIEPRCVELGTRVLCTLQAKYAEVGPTATNGRRETFVRTLLNVCQNIYERFPKGFQAAAGSSEQLQLQFEKERAMSTMRLLGNLHVKKLIPAKVIFHVVHDFIGIDVGSPEDVHVDLVCTLLETCGHDLDSMPQGRKLMCSIAARLCNLCQSDSGGVPAYPAELISRVEALLVLRKRGW